MSMTRYDLSRAATLALALVLLAFAGCGDARRGADAPVPLADGEAAVHPLLAARTAEFERRVYTVTDGVHVAVGFGLANSILVEGEDCDFVVDTMASVESARAVRAAFAEKSSRPIGALIYTHNHADHIFGARGFVPEGEIDVYAHETTNYYIDRLISVLRPIVGVRSERMFGNHLPKTGDDRLVNSGIGPFLEAAHGGGTPSLIRPNRTFSERLDTTLCGVKVELVHAPGETNDQLFVWLPEKRTLLPGDNVYKAFPNLYTIRGTLSRDVLEWSRSIDAMRALRPEHLVPSHTRPVSGAGKIDEILTAYRDAIQYVHDQTIRGMNRGLTPDELVEVIELPPHLKRHPYLEELYGTVEWSVRSVYAGYLGWFDGDTATLSPVSPRERAAGLVALAGGEEALLAATRTAVAEGRYAWAAELASALLAHDPQLAEAKRLKAQSLRVLGHRSISPNGRNYYLTQALELEGKAEVVVQKPTPEMLELAKAMPIENFIAAMPANLNPERSADADTVMGFRFPDVGETFTLHVRRGVAEFRRGFPAEPDVAIRASSAAWVEVVAGARGLPAAVASGDIEIEGGLTQVPAAIAFLAMFRD
jgi:alkyl sulfatase BDS1-like metallo-beta-lactamase superfamily hydrolase